MLLGVSESSLTSHERTLLDMQGYVIFRDVLSEETLDRLRRAFDYSVHKAQGSAEQKETGTRHLSEFGGMDETVWQVCVHPLVLASAFYVLKRRFFARIPHGREPLPGFGQQGLHMDWHGGQSGRFHVVTAIYLLDEFTADNGATRLVAGSHRTPMSTNRKIGDSGFMHSEQVTVLAPAGAVLVINGNLLHSGTRNRSQMRRRTLQVSFLAYEHLSSTTRGTAPAGVSNPAARYILLPS